MASKVIKDNDGVAIVEGTPEASLIKDSKKFFNAPLPERKAGDKIVEAGLAQEPQDQASFKLVSRDLSAEDRKQMNNPPTSDPVPVLETLREGSKFAEPAMKSNVKEKTPQETEPKRKEAVNKSKVFRRKRFIERSAGEQAATQGSFISTLNN